MEHQQLINFLCVCEEKNISLAAKRLFMTQQGLSKSIQLLEENLDVPLFFRTYRGIELTEFGATLENAARSFLNQHDHIVDGIREQKEKSRSKISIGMILGAGDCLPPGFFGNFIIQHPEIDIHLTSYKQENCLDNILENKDHVGFATLPIDFTLFDSIWSQRLKVSLMVGEDHPLARRTSIKFQELKNETLITLNSQSAPRIIVEKTCAQYGFKPKILLAGIENKLMHELCRTNRVVSLFMTPFDKLPGIKKVEIEDLELYWEFHLLVNKHAHLSAAVQTFIQYAKTALKKWPE
jgi:DNA-binding transcriptional LysR family regulator